jgi:hypothetical protein
MPESGSEQEETDEIEVNGMKRKHAETRAPHRQKPDEYDSFDLFCRKDFRNGRKSCLVIVFGII